MSCTFAKQVDRHFAGSIDPRSEHALRDHLSDCTPCRDRYERRLLLERIDPNARGTEERLGRGLGFRPPRLRWLGAGAAIAAAAAAAFVLTSSRHLQTAQVSDAEWAVRGGGKVTKSSIPELKMFKLGPGDVSRPVKDAIGNKDELAFTYRNPGDAKYLLVFGVDEHHHVYWYYPAWLDPSKKPVAVKIASDDDDHELPEAIVHPLDGEKLEVVAVFASKQVSVAEVEQKIAEHGPDAPLGIGVEARTRLRVEK